MVYAPRFNRANDVVGAGFLGRRTGSYKALRNTKRNTRISVKPYQAPCQPGKPLLHAFRLFRPRRGGRFGQFNGWSLIYKFTAPPLAREVAVRERHAVEGRER